jgi:hypothetical protein
MATRPRKSKAWYIHYPGDAYAMGPVCFDAPVGVMAVREWAKDWEKVSKLPVGVACWPTKD